MASEPNEPGQANAALRLMRVDVVGGAAMVFIAGLVLYGASGLKMGTIVNFGPGAMPTVLAAILGVAGIAVALNGLIGHGDGAERVRLVLRPPLVLSLAICLFALFIRGGDFGLFATPKLGLAVLGPPIVFIAGYATPEADAKELLVLAFGLTAAVLFVFPDMLGVPIPVFPAIVEKAIPPSFGEDMAVRVVYAAYAALSGYLYFRLFARGSRQSD